MEQTDLTKYQKEFEALQHSLRQYCYRKETQEQIGQYIQALLLSPPQKELLDTCRTSWESRPAKNAAASQNR